MSSETWMFLFDGDCGLCQRTAEWLRARTRPGSLHVRAWQTLHELPAGVDADRLEREAVLVRGERIDGGFDAFAGLGARVRGLWPIGLLGRVPGAAWVGRRLYEIVARHRRALSVRLGMSVCALPSLDPPSSPSADPRWRGYADPKKRAVGFKLCEGMEIPKELGKFTFARQRSKLAGTIRGSYLVIKKKY